VLNGHLDGRRATRHRHSNGRMQVLERFRDDHDFRKAIKLSLVRQTLLPPGLERDVHPFEKTRASAMASPALGDRPPLDAVQEAEGREMVRALLDDMERREPHLGMGIKQQASIDRAREQLGLQS
jgi:hypothetical protein